MLQSRTCHCHLSLILWKWTKSCIFFRDPDSNVHPKANEIDVVGMLVDLMTHQHSWAATSSNEEPTAMTVREGPIVLMITTREGPAMMMTITTNKGTSKERSPQKIII